MKKKLLYIFFFWLLIFACAPINELSKSTQLATHQVASLAQGNLVFACPDGIYQYEIKGNKINLLTTDKTRLYVDVNLTEEWIYYLRSTDVREQEFPSGGGHGPNDIFRMKLDGTEFEQLIIDDYYDLNLTVLPTTHKLVYVSDRIEPDHSPNRYKVIVWNIDKKTEEVVVENSEPILPVRSPKESKVGLLEMPVPLKDKIKLLVLDLQDNFVIELIPDQNITPGKFSWSPDEKYIVLGIKQDKAFDIAFINPTTGKIEKEIAIKDEPRNFVWSPDGKMILFETWIYSSETDISIKLWLLDISNEQIVILYEGGLDARFFSYNAVWSPDSKHIAFFTNPDNLNLKLNIQNIEASEKFTSEMPCSYTGTVAWVTLR